MQTFRSSNRFPLRSWARGAVGIALIGGLAACAHSEMAATTASPAGPTKTVSKEAGAMAAVRKRASFDLGCAAQDVTVAQIESGTFMHPATYGATCGEKRASYLERMGTIIKQ